MAAGDGGSRGSRSRRVRLPGIAELVRPSSAESAVDDHRQASGRQAHAQKITVYLSAEELLDLEHARLILRGHGITADRGRIVREAIAVLLAFPRASRSASICATASRTRRPRSTEMP